ncbi:MAG: hypothetical protein CL868_19780 [Cytophagaceae bacterium]|nr:hypothetical protein [Cytophagaceae bacterium]|tara:strand:+ start:5954 stop:6181 length:228 start_codon:yes stop_codon:yes gene_type:complete
MRIFTLCLSTFLLVSASPSLIETMIAKVFICKGKSSKKYHYKKNCRGLSNCSTPVAEVTLEEAKRLKHTLCGWED